MFFSPGEVGELACVGFVIIQFFAAAFAAPTNIAVAIRADGAARNKLGEGCLLPATSRVLQDWYEALPLEIRECFETAQLGERGVDVNELHQRPGGATVATH